ncbi:DUF3987 domain-containing protein [Aeromonas jandaei]|uniref:DUF3987 domain-containing protein n=1 Tax=Aeromonas jandaei TaxID=650 RepID=UPI003F798197
MNTTPIKLNLIGEFPIHVLEEQLQGVMRQIQQQTQAPLGLIASSVLSAMGLACQDLVDVSPKAGLIHPVSLFFITKADWVNEKQRLTSW